MLIDKMDERKTVVFPVWIQFGAPLFKEELPLVERDLDAALPLAASQASLFKEELPLVDRDFGAALPLAASQAPLFNEELPLVDRDLGAALPLVALPSPRQREPIGRLPAIFCV